MVIKKLSCVSKVEIPGDVKARLAIDSRRACGNCRLKIRKRVVLPRVFDLVYSVVRLLEVWEDCWMIKRAAIDVTDIVEEVKILVAVGMIREKKIRRFAGRVSWIAGVAPCAKAFAAIVHAAAHDDPKKMSNKAVRRRASART